MESTPVIGHDGTVYITSTDGNLYGLDGVTGAVLWSFSTGAETTGTPAMGPNGDIVYSAGNGNMNANNPANGGSLVWWQPVAGSSWSSPVIDRSGRLFIGSSDNNLCVPMVLTCRCKLLPAVWCLVLQVAASCSSTAKSCRISRSLISESGVCVWYSVPRLNPLAGTPWTSQPGTPFGVRPRQALSLLHPPSARTAWSTLAPTTSPCTRTRARRRGDSEWSDSESWPGVMHSGRSPARLHVTD